MWLTLKHILIAACSSVGIILNRFYSISCCDFDLKIKLKIIISLILLIQTKSPNKYPSYLYSYIDSTLLNDLDRRPWFVPVSGVCRNQNSRMFIPTKSASSYKKSGQPWTSVIPFRHWLSSVLLCKITKCIISSW